jgi:hypothetical protein
LVAFAACNGGSKPVGSSAAKVTDAVTANAGDACGGDDPNAASCDESQDLYCAQDPNADPSAPGTCASCGDLGSISLVCNDGTIQAGQWVAVAQTCQIIGCGTAQLGDPCDNSAADPALTCALPLSCAPGSAGQSGSCVDGSSEDAGAPPATDPGDDAGSADDGASGAGEDADPGSPSPGDDAGDPTAEDGGADTADAGADTLDDGGPASMVRGARHS